MAQRKTMSIGGATYDLFVRTGAAAQQHCATDDKTLALPLGGKVRVQEVIETCGGGANNTSVGLARLGCAAGFCGVIGDDQWGQVLQRNFAREGVNTDSVTIVENEMTSFSIILSSVSGERVILYEPGTNSHMHDSIFNREAIRDVDWVFLNHIQEHTCIIQDDIVDILVGGAGSIRFSWNPGGPQLTCGIDEPNHRLLLQNTTVLLLNKEEALSFTKTDDVSVAIKILLELGVANICITDGKKGCLATDGQQMYDCPVLQTDDAIDATGAGDAFGTGVTWGLLQGFDLPTALKAGSINAASVVRAIGAQAGLLTDTDMQQRLANSVLEVKTTSLS